MPKKKRIKKKKNRFEFPTQQLKSEFIELVKVFVDNKPKNILEIGQWDGGTLKFWMKYALPGSKIIALDINHDRMGDKYKQWLDISRFEFYKITADSSSEETFNKVKEIMPSIDFAFIDGSHLYEDVKKDFELYRKIMSKGGIMALHDVHKGKDQKKYGWGASKLWDEIKKTGIKTREIIHSKKDSKESNGIGIVYV